MSENQMQANGNDCDETPEDIKISCLYLCGKYLSGIWSRLSPEQVVVNCISHGCNNRLYHCTIDDSSRDVSDEAPQEVAIRLYGDKQFKEDEVSDRDSHEIVALLMSENGLGPKVFGMFKEGHIMAFIKVCSWKDC